MIRRIFSCLLPVLAALMSIPVNSQEVRDEDLIQFSGVTITADSLNAVPFTKVIVRNTARGTVTDNYGYFSFVAHKRDTVVFSALGYKKVSFIIPDTITKQRYSLIQLMTADTLVLAPAYIFPWPTLEDFKRAFVNADIPDDQIEIARKNLSAANIKMMAAQLGPDGRENYTISMQNQTSKLYYFGQQQPFTIFNPFAWAQFIKAWKEGRFKKKENKEP